MVKSWCISLFYYKLPVFKRRKSQGMSATEIETTYTPKCIKIVHSVEFQTKLGKHFGQKTKLYIPSSTIKTNYLIRHPQLIVDALTYFDKKAKIINFLPMMLINLFCADATMSRNSIFVFILAMKIGKIPILKRRII